MLEREEIRQMSKFKPGDVLAIVDNRIIPDAWVGDLAVVVDPTSMPARRSELIKKLGGDMASFDDFVFVEWVWARAKHPKDGAFYASRFRLAKLAAEREVPAKKVGKKPWK